MPPLTVVRGTGNRVEPNWADWVAEQIYDIADEQHVSITYRWRMVARIRSWLRDACTPGETVDVFALSERWINPPAPAQTEQSQ